jgi:uncharacterized membrane protein YjjP (DUF1212 family)
VDSVFKVFGTNEATGEQMNLREIGELNNERFLREAFDATCRKKLIRSARLRRNVYLILFFVGFFCIFIAGFSGRVLLSVLSLFLSTLSLVVMTKYDTQLFFLKMIEEEEGNPEP